jgi:hypothetical protein
VLKVTFDQAPGSCVVSCLNRALQVEMIAKLWDEEIRNESVGSGAMDR